MQAHWLDEHDPYADAMGTRGIGEIGIVGTAAAVVNAVQRATGVRVRHLPATLDELLTGLPWEDHLPSAPRGRPPSSPASVSSRGRRRASRLQPAIVWRSGSIQTVTRSVLMFSAG